MPGISPGIIVAGYEIVRRLGAGGMGEVWLAKQTAMDRKVALKILSPALTSNKEFVDRFLKEVKNAAKLEHQNIVTAYDAGCDGSIYYLAMSFVDGALLDDLLKIDKRIPEKEALRIARGVADALCYAWNEYKILHRDIKPANIMLDSRKNPKLMDMGISKSMSEDKGLTMTGMIVGTPYYMSPEQAKAEPGIDCRADIYSLGATLYHLVTGTVPYEAQTAMAILMKHMTDPFPPPKEKNPEVSDGCSALLEIMMAKMPADRQTSWEDVIKDIDLVASGQMPATRRPSAGKSAVMQETPSQQISRRKVLEDIHKPKKPLAKASLISKAAQRTPQPQPEPEAKKEDSYLSYVLIGVCTTFAVLIVCGLIILNKVSKDRTPAKMPAAATKPAATSPAVATPPSGGRSQAEPPSGDEKRLSTAQPSTNAAPAVDDATAEKMIKNAIEELKKKNPQQKELYSNLLKGIKGWRLYIGGYEITDITPLKNMPLEMLSLDNLQQLSDISPLKGMPLTTLSVAATKIKDISALRGMKLDILNLGYTQVNDINALEGMPLKALYLHYSKIDNISVLKNMPLEHLDLLGCQYLNDISPLVDCKQLRRLSIPEHSKNIEFLRNLPNLEILDCKLDASNSKQTAADFWKAWDAEHGKTATPSSFQENRLSTAQPSTPAVPAVDDATAEKMIKNAIEELKKKNPQVKDLKASHKKTDIGWLLDLSRNSDLADISPLTGLPIGCLRLEACLRITDIFPLKDLPLKRLDLINTNIGDISVLRNMQSLKSLDLYSCSKIIDFTPIKGMQLNYLNVSHTNFADWALLKDMPLTNLGLDGLLINDYSFLKGMSLVSLGLSGCLVTDLSVLKGLPLKDLIISFNPVNDLYPLQGCLLDYICIENTDIKDISPLQGMPLTRLVASNSLISDLGPIRGMKLTWLTIDSTQVSDLTPLEGMPLELISITPSHITKGLEIVRNNKSIKQIGHHPFCLLSPSEFWLKYDSGAFGRPGDPPPVIKTAEDAQNFLKRYMPESEAKKVTFTMDKGRICAVDYLGYFRSTDAAEILRGLPLSNLNCNYSGIRDLSVLKGMPLTSLHLQHNPVSDLRPISGMPINYLQITDTFISDLSPIKGMPLATLDCSHTLVSDLTPLAGMKLTQLNLMDSQVSDISVLKGMPLTSLSLSANVSDISALKGMLLIRLHMAKSKVSDLGALKGMPLKTLNMYLCTEVKDISALKGMPLEELDLYGCKNLNDLSPLAECKSLKRLSIPEHCRNIEFLKNLPALEILDNKAAINSSKQTPAEFWKKWDK